MVYCAPSGDEYKMPESMIQPGQVCAALYAQDDNWHRAYITGIKSLDYVEVCTSPVEYNSSVIIIHMKCNC